MEFNSCLLIKSNCLVKIQYVIYVLYIMVLCKYRVHNTSGMVYNTFILYLLHVEIHTYTPTHNLKWLFVIFTAVYQNRIFDINLDFRILISNIRTQIHLRF